MITSPLKKHDVCKKTKKLRTCATILISYDKKHILFGKITFKNKYDLPKGKKEKNESCLEAAIRELKEETGLLIPKEDYMEYINSSITFKYTQEKDITLFFVWDKNNLYLNDDSFKNLKCNSFFILQDFVNEKENSSRFKQIIGNIYPELEDFKLLNLELLLNDDKYGRDNLNFSMFKTFRRKGFKKAINKILL